MYRNLTKIVIVSLLLLCFSFRVSAPDRKSFIIFIPAPDQPYKRLVFAIGMVETKGDTLAYNPLEEAAGYFQIRPIRLTDYNNRTGNRYTRQDLFNFEISERIFLYFADQIGPYDLEKIAKKWNGSGQLTIDYWTRIMQHL